MPNLRILSILAAISLSSVIIIPLVLSRKSLILEGDFKRNIVNNNFIIDKKFTLSEDKAGGIKFFKNEIFINNLSKIERYSMNGTMLNSYPIQSESTTGLIIGWDVDSSVISIEDCRNKQIIQYVHYESSKEYKTFKYNKAFQRSVKLTGEKYLFKGGIDYIKIKSVDFNSLDSNTLDVLPNIKDGGITTDGYFVKSLNGKVLHVFYYLNKFQCFDSNGNFLYEVKTIDGDNTLPEVIRYGKAYKPSPDVKTFHKDAFADKDKLYIISKVKSIDLSKETFDSKSIIDIYSINNGSYLRSILIPNFNGKKVNRLTSDNMGNFYGLYGKNIVLIKSSIII